MDFETLKISSEDGVLFAEIAAPPMNLIGPALVRDLVFPHSALLLQRRMSAYGTKRTSGRAQSMSAFGGKADIGRS